MSKMLGIRFTLAELTAIHKAAKERGTTASAMIRSLLNEVLGIKEVRTNV